MITAPASDKQLSFLGSLLDEREMTTEQRAGIEWMVDTGVSKNEASLLIQQVLTYPRKASILPELPPVPAGRYAIRTQDGHLAFYKVDAPTEGRWAGYVFVTLLIGGDREQKLGKAQARSVLTTLAQDPLAASMTYGKEFGHCGVCGRSLTDAESRTRGIGPICYSKF